jgi:RNA polymerase sigma-70 factor (ECF subfamily)
MVNNEKHLLSGLQSGDEETYIFLFREYYVSLCAYSQRYVGRKDIAEEIVSEIFFKMWSNRKSLKITDSIKGYLFRAVANNSLYHLRKVKKEKSLEEYLSARAIENNRSAAYPDEIVEQSLAMEVIHNQIEEAVNHLPTQQQRAFKLKRFEGKKNKEVAEEMELSVKTVEMHLSKAMTTIRERLKDTLPAFLLFMLLK